jgi:transposase-like protein
MNVRVRSTFTRLCPLPGCPASTRGPEFGRVIRKGDFLRKSDSVRVPRFRCRDCKRSFSSAFGTDTYRQKKRHMNASVFRLYASLMTQRRIAQTLGLSRTTVSRKFVFLGLRALRDHERFLNEFTQGGRVLIDSLQFDEVVTTERSKCLPLSIPLVVHPASRKILGFGVASMPATGPLAKIALKKYGKRRDNRAEIAARVFERLAPHVSPTVAIRTDQCPFYPGWIQAQWKQARHETVKGRRGCVAGQGELKRTGFDPLFSLNHTAAMLRGNMSRLIRRTWCRTQKPERLLLHLALYAQFHNEVLTPAYTPLAS